VFQNAVPTPDVTNPVSLPTFIFCRLFFYSYTFRITSLLARSVQMIFSVLLQHHVSELFRYSDLGIQASNFNVSLTVHRDISVQ